MLNDRRKISLSLSFLFHDFSVAEIRGRCRPVRVCHNVPDTPDNEEAGEIQVVWSYKGYYVGPLRQGDKVIGPTLTV